MSLVLLPAAAAEELGLSLLFGAAHLANPDAARLALGNIALAGGFLGLTFFTPGGLWTATGAHLGWNLTLAGLAAPVSGIPFTMPGLDYVAGGSVLAIRRSRKGKQRT